MNPGLGDGELGVISLALESKGNEVTLIDDKRARKAATFYGLNIHGTLWLLIQFKKCGVMGKEETREKIKELPRHGFWISETQLREALELVEVDC